MRYIIIHWGHTELYRVPTMVDYHYFCLNGRSYPHSNIGVHHGL